MTTQPEPIIPAEQQAELSKAGQLYAEALQDAARKTVAYFAAVDAYYAAITPPSTVDKEAS